MAKLLNKEDFDRIMGIEAENYNEFVKKLFLVYPQGIDISKMSLSQKQKFRAKEWSYSVCGNIIYNAPNLICERCNNKKIARLIYGDVFMRMCNKDRKKREKFYFEHMGLFINPSPTKPKDAKDYICLECGNEW